MRKEAKRGFVLALTTAMATQLAVAQPLGLQSAAATNDKALRGYVPYQTALASQYGAPFILRHGPMLERRRVCLWDGRWIECGYLKIQNASHLTDAERRAIVETMRDPCSKITISGIGAVLASRSEQSSHPRKEVADKRLARLNKFCSQAVLSADDVRLALPSARARQGEDAMSSNDEIAYEARIERKQDISVRNQK